MESHVATPRLALPRNSSFERWIQAEYKLLEAMATNPGKLLTHRWLLQRVWGPQYGEERNYLRVYVRQLRQKLGDDAAAPTYITTESGVGYRWMVEPSG